MMNSLAESLAVKRTWTFVLLGLARRLYLLIALLSLMAAVVALVAVLFLQMKKQAGVSQAPVPGPYTAAPSSVDVKIIEGYLQGPSDVRFVLLRPVIDKPLKGDEILGYFEARSANPLMAYPNDIEILEGGDAALFNRVPVTAPQQQGQRSALRGRPALVQEINKAFAVGETAGKREFELSVRARDAFGNRTEPLKIVFSLSFGSVSDAAQQPSFVQETGPLPMTALQALARDVALMIDPGRSPAYFDAYRKALELPRACGAADNDATFVANYRAAFEHVKAAAEAVGIESRPLNQDAFNAGMCRSWRMVVDARNNEAARREAERAAVHAQNERAKFEAELEKIAFSRMQMWALSVLGGALLIFMLVALFLAFLAMENHSKAMRDAFEAFSRERRPHDQPAA